MYGEDDFLEAYYEDRNGGEVDYSPEDFDEADLDDYREDYLAENGEDE